MFSHYTKFISRLVSAALAASALSASLSSNADMRKTSPVARDPQVQVMVLGAYHFGNPGLDVANVKADDVTAPRRQQELADLTRQLAKFAPTKVMVEMVPAKDSAKIDAYEKFSSADLLKDKNEITQIGFRLARHLNHESVYAIDEQSDSFDYFPFDKVQAYAKARGIDPELNALTERWSNQAKKFELAQKTNTISQLLRILNAPEQIQRDQNQYMAILRFGHGSEWPGADLNAAWYLRNAKIHSKLMKLATPGDRIVVIYGAGHNYALRELVKTTPGYRLVEPLLYLR